MFLLASGSQNKEADESHKQTEEEREEVGLKTVAHSTASLYVILRGVQ